MKQYGPANSIRLFGRLDLVFEARFSLGDKADSGFYLQPDRAKLTVVSQKDKEVTIAFLSAGDFVGEESLATVHGPRLSTAIAVNACTALKIAREEMLHELHEETAFVDIVFKLLFECSMNTQDDLIDRLFNSAGKCLARILLLMPEFGSPDGWGRKPAFVRLPRRRWRRRSRPRSSSKNATRSW
jgi:CRP-like cAMP-binding protein